MKRSPKNVLDNVDKLLAFLYLCFLGIGLLSVYSAGYKESAQDIFDFDQRHGKQLVWIIFALLIAFLILLIESDLIKLASYPSYVICLLVMVGVLFLGTEVKGARAWFQIGNFSLQPSEFAKVATSLALANYLGNLNVDLKYLKTKLIAFGIIFLPAAIIILQNDTGSALVYSAFLLALYREGLSGAFLFFGFYSAIFVSLCIIFQKVSVELPFNFFIEGDNIVLLLIIAIALIAMYYTKKQKRNWWKIIGVVLYSILLSYSVDLLFEKILAPHQAKRILVVLGIEEDLQGVGYNVEQSLIAIGSGGITGKGFLEGTQTKLNFVPEQITDFIFTAIGEEWGFLGSFIIITLYLIFLIKIINVAERQKSAFGRIYGYCVASIFLFHFLINIGMVIGLVPVIGIPLPFLSYGGSSLWSFTILLFILIKLDADRSLKLR